MFVAIAIVFEVACFLILPFMMGVQFGDLFGIFAYTIYWLFLIAALLMAWDWDDILFASKQAIGSFQEKSSSVQDLIQEILLMATVARKEGILQLEANSGSLQDGEWKQALRHVIDGTPIDQLRDLLKVEDLAAAPSVSVQIMDFGRKASLWSGLFASIMAVAQTFSEYRGEYWFRQFAADGMPIALAIGVNFMFFIPARIRLQKRVHDEWLRKKLIAQGVFGIAESIAPQSLEQRLRSLAGN